MLPLAFEIWGFRTVQVMMLKRHKNPRLMQKIRKCLLQLKRILRRKMKTKMFCCGASISCASALTCTDQFLFLGLFQAAVSQTHQRRTWILLQGRRKCFLKIHVILHLPINFIYSTLHRFEYLSSREPLYKFKFGISICHLLFFICWDF
ncbi:hypothetical protein OIU78_004114 [Salix suchowensis]|nr:hypothetical protein OIU78_004114 [Salix suchowensis]